jgi:hypothetical protein
MNRLIATTEPTREFPNPIDVVFSAYV